MNKNHVIAALVLTSTIFLTGCSTGADVNTVNDEPKQGENNQEFIVKAPVEGEVDPSAYVIEILPKDLPEIPLASNSYIDGSYSTFKTDAGNQTWSISIIAEENLEATIADAFTNSGYTQTLTMEQTNGKAQAFENPSYKVTVATAEKNAGTPFSYVYAITEKTTVTN